MILRFFLLLIMFWASPLLAKELHFKSSNSSKLIELFTSQGCSSCPIAERWLNRFVDDPKLWVEVVPVAFHVDYWDQLGWKDIYASADYSNRQRRYRANNNIKSVYTPGFVVNGKEWRGFYRKTSLPSVNNASELKAHLKDSNLTVSYTSNTVSEKNSLILNVAVVGADIVTHVKNGENAHRKLTQQFVVLNHVTHKSNDNDWVLPINTQPHLTAPRLAIAIWLQDAHTLEVVQATGGWL